MKYLKNLFSIIIILVSLVSVLSIKSYSFLKKKYSVRLFYILGDILYALGITLLGSATFSFGIIGIFSESGLSGAALIVIGAIYREKIHNKEIRNGNYSNVVASYTLWLYSTRKTTKQ